MNNKSHQTLLQSLKAKIPRKIRRFVINPILVITLVAGVISAFKGIFTWWSILSWAVYFSVALIGFIDWLQVKRKP